MAAKSTGNIINVDAGNAVSFTLTSLNRIPRWARETLATGWAVSLTRSLGRFFPRFSG
jgi:hypothetical protein